MCIRDRDLIATVLSNGNSVRKIGTFGDEVGLTQIMICLLYTSIVHFKKEKRISAKSISIKKMHRNGRLEQRRSRYHVL